MTILKNKNHFLVALLSACLYIFLAYFLKREQFIPLLIVVAILFGTYAYFINQKTLSSKYLFQFGLIFRSVFLLSTPFLSQDFYRFIWDGRLIMQHLSPFEFAPNSIINTTTISQARQLFDGMGNLSAGHYSNYPPVNQLFFASAALLSSKSILGSIIILRLEIIAADVAIYFIGKSILKRFSLNQNAFKSASVIGETDLKLACSFECILKRENIVCVRKHTVSTPMVLGTICHPRGAS